MTSFRKYLRTKSGKVGFVFHLAALSYIPARAASPSFDPNFLPERCQKPKSMALVSTFERKQMWGFLWDMDSLEGVRARKGWTSSQKSCFDLLKDQGLNWVQAYSGKKTADVMAFRAAALYYGDPNRGHALLAAQEAIALSKGDHVVAQYIRASSLGVTQKTDITAALKQASYSNGQDEFDDVLRRRSMLLLTTRLSGKALFEASGHWLKFYPKDVDVMLTRFNSAIATKNIKTAQALLRNFEDRDLSRSETSLAALRAEILFGHNKFRDAGLIYESLLNDKSLSPQRRRHYLQRFLETTVQNNEWVKARATLEKLLPTDSKNQRYLHFYEVSIENGALDSKNPIKDAERAMSFLPDSFLVKYTLAKFLIREFESGARQDKANLMARADSLVNQLNSMAPTSVDVNFLTAKAFFLKKAFLKAENSVRSALAGSKEPAATYQTSISDLYELSARIMWARGDWGEARRLAREGIDRISLRKQKAPLQKLLREIPLR